jgi:hypothetical protein
MISSPKPMGKSVHYIAIYFMNGFENQKEKGVYKGINDEEHDEDE